jgi:hypothetical protein
MWKTWVKSMLMNCVSRAVAKNTRIWCSFAARVCVCVYVDTNKQTQATTRFVSHNLEDVGRRSVTGLLAPCSGRWSSCGAAAANRSRAPCPYTMYRHAMRALC